MELYFAPMEGITTSVYRRVHAGMFGGVDRYYIPFFSPTSDHLFTPRQLRELAPSGVPGLRAVPQVLTKDPADLLWALDGLRDMGYREADLNAGCPSATVVSKGKGAGLLRDPRALDALLAGAFERCPLELSVKTRLGFQDPGEFPALLEIMNRYPVGELILHCRTRQEMYQEPVHREWFDLARRESRAPLCYNGDLFTPEDVAAFAARYPGERAVMLGRGAARDPALFRRVRGGPAASRRELAEFHGALYEEYIGLYGRLNGMRRMKELWSYMIGSFSGAEELRKKMMRTKDTSVFEGCVSAILQDLPLAWE